jgi:uncharacterized DUF497 family protein
MRFKWDDEKNRINQRKHGGLAFETAALVFNDPLTLFRKDRIVEGEQRWHAIGSARGAVLLVVHVYRVEDPHDEEENIRIISAREANKRERRIYFQQASE